MAFEMNEAAVVASTDEAVLPFGAAKAGWCCGTVGFGPTWWFLVDEAAPCGKRGVIEIVASRCELRSDGVALALTERNDLFGHPKHPDVAAVAEVRNEDRRPRYRLVQGVSKHQRPMSRAGIAHRGGEIINDADRVDPE